MFETLLAQFVGREVDPFLFPVGVAAGLFLLQVADLGVGELGCQPHQLGLGLGYHLVELGAHRVVGAAGLVGRHGRRQLLLHLLQQLGMPGQHDAAVPLVQVTQFVAHAIGLGFRQVEVAVELPVGQVWHLVVGQFDGAAALQQQTAGCQGGSTQCCANW